MPDNDNTTATTAPATVTTESPASPPAQGGSSPKLHTQEDVNRIVAQRLAEDRARRPAAAAPQKPAAAKSTATAAPDYQAELQELKRQQTELTQRLDFEKRTGKLGLDDKKASALFKVYQTNPEGFDDVVSALGLQPSTQTTQQATTADPARPPTAAPASSVGTRVDQATSDGLTDLWKLTPAQLDQLGPSGIRREYEKILEQAKRRQGAPRPRVPQRK